MDQIWKCCPQLTRRHGRASDRLIQGRQFTSINLDLAGKLNVSVPRSRLTYKHALSMASCRTPGLAERAPAQPCCSLAFSTNVKLPPVCVRGVRACAEVDPETSKQVLLNHCLLTAAPRTCSLQTSAHSNVLDMFSLFAFVHTCVIRFAACRWPLPQEMLKRRCQFGSVENKRKIGSRRPVIYPLGYTYCFHLSQR